MVKKNCIAVIPARGGSKRIPKKNIIDFFGKPMIAWTIESALGSNIFDRVIVSTDSEEIKKVAEAYGAEVPFIRDQCADDHTPVSEVTAYVLGQVQDKFDEVYKTVIQLMPNCPLRQASHILGAYKHFLCSKASFQISCFKMGWMNPWWALRLNDDGRGEPLFSDQVQLRSQDLPPLYCPTGAVWIADAEILMKSKTFYMPDRIYYPLDFQAAIDIDDESDLKMARGFKLIEECYVR